MSDKKKDNDFVENLEDWEKDEILKVWNAVKMSLSYGGFLYLLQPPLCIMYGYYLSAGPQKKLRGLQVNRYRLSTPALHRIIADLDN